MPYCDKKTMSFLLTTRCNMHCKYCYGSRNADYQTLDWRFAKRAMDDYLGVGGLKEIRFFADGEPTTEMELLKQIFSYAKNLDSSIKAEVQTNGIFNEATADWLGSNLDYINVSVDLLPEDNDKYRITPDGKPSSPLIEKTLMYLHNMPNRKAEIILRATITKYNIGRQVEGIKYYNQKYGVNVFWVDPIFPPVSAEEKTYEEIDLMQFARSFIEAHNYAWKNNIFYESNLTTNFDGDTDKACRSCLPMPHLTVDGYFSACEMATFGKNAGKMSDMIYGKYDEENDKIDIYDDKIMNIRRRTLINMTPSRDGKYDCRSCVVAKHCAGYCLGETLNEQGSLFEIKTRSCPAIRYIYGEIGHLYEEKFGEEGFPHRHP